MKKKERKKKNCVEGIDVFSCCVTSVLSSFVLQRLQGYFDLSDVLLLANVSDPPLLQVTQHTPLQTTSSL